MTWKVDKQPMASPAESHHWPTEDEPELPCYWDNIDIPYQPVPMPMPIAVPMSILANAFRLTPTPTPPPVPQEQCTPPSEELTAKNAVANLGQPITPENYRLPPVPLRTLTPMAQNINDDIPLMPM